MKLQAWAQLPQHAPCCHLSFLPCCLAPFSDRQQCCLFLFLPFLPFVTQPLCLPFPASCSPYSVAAVPVPVSSAQCPKLAPPVRPPVAPPAPISFVASSFSPLVRRPFEQIQQTYVFNAEARHMHSDTPSNHLLRQSTFHPWPPTPPLPSPPSPLGLPPKTPIALHIGGLRRAASLCLPPVFSPSLFPSPFLPFFLLNVFLTM